ncbi:uncharacterized protein KGF55_005463 [Candida pseudojiufengensis]|uniref:uncharacterized protein n=1 Tax=Candida pseudojiufengensis TaxID=497109 RepID=UPI002224BB3D|nr:uncharacterized protein KGF55_005463 [Candida pseudojiufengensis]KAI5959313.1 hypothetical protein KGF55_005463 [Candida pseudojiufengensis]
MTSNEDFAMALCHLSITAGAASQVKVSPRRDKQWFTIELKDDGDIGTFPLINVGGVSVIKYTGEIFAVAPAFIDDADDGFDHVIIVNVDKHDDGKIKQISRPLLVRSSIINA